MNNLLENGRSDTINLGTGKGCSNKEVLDEVKNISGTDFKIVESARREGDPSVLIASAEKAQRVLNWEPKYSDLKTIVQTAYKWHEKNPQGY